MMIPPSGIQDGGLTYKTDPLQIFVGRIEMDGVLSMEDWKTLPNPSLHPNTARWAAPGELFVLGDCVTENRGALPGV